jgi:hypothetical protein
LTDYSAILNRRELDEIIECVVSSVKKNFKVDFALSRSTKDSSCRGPPRCVSHGEVRGCISNDSMFFLLRGGEAMSLFGFCSFALRLRGISNFAPQKLRSNRASPLSPLSTEWKEYSLAPTEVCRRSLRHHHLHHLHGR